MGLRAVLLAAVAALGLGALGLWWAAPSVLADAGRLMQRDTLDALVARAGLWGPALIVGLMVVAVVVSPLPSAPIALAAGAAYGHLWGAVQVALGAELGALIAFALARALGRDALRRLFGDRVDRGLLGSQNVLTGTIFASRLLPFVSFDVMSYAAGLSGLHAWRFALATLAGILPASFLLAHLGAAAVDAQMGRAAWAALGLGLATAAPLLWLATRRQAEKES